MEYVHLAVQHILVVFKNITCRNDDQTQILSWNENAYNYMFIMEQDFIDY